VVVGQKGCVVRQHLDARVGVEEEEIAGLARNHLVRVRRLVGRFRVVVHEVVATLLLLHQALDQLVLGQDSRDEEDLGVAHHEAGQVLARLLAQMGDLRIEAAGGLGCQNFCGVLGAVEVILLGLEERLEGFVVDHVPEQDDGVRLEVAQVGHDLFVHVAIVCRPERVGDDHHAAPVGKRDIENARFDQRRFGDFLDRYALEASSFVSHVTVSLAYADASF
jgi:hypothetical protein